MSILDISISKEPSIKFLSIFQYWFAFFLFIYASTKPIISIVSIYTPATELYLIWELNDYSYSFNDLSPFAPRYVLIIVLLLLSALRVEKFDITSKLITIITLVLIYDFYKYLNSYHESISITSNPAEVSLEYLSEITHIIEQISVISMEQNLQTLHIEALLLQSKIAFFSRDVNLSNKLIEEARSIALEHKLEHLHTMVENEEKFISAEIEIASEIIDKGTHFRDRLEKIKIIDYINEMKKLNIA